MKLLLDENVPHALRHTIVGHQCFTVAYQGWGGTTNGKLLALAAQTEFNALVTLDANIESQQNASNLPLSVIVLHSASNDIEDLLPLVPALLEALKQLAPKRFTHIH